MFVMDNVSNNDTLMENIAIKCAAADISFDATDARIRCMPHTAHLAAIKVTDSPLFLFVTNRWSSFLRLLVPYPNRLARRQRVNSQHTRMP
jgi:hypothetical protein